MAASPAVSDPWPALRVDDWQPTRDTLHMWTQIVGKVRMAHTPLVNHWWQVPLYVSARGLTTSAIPYRTRVFEIEFDLSGHRLAIRDSSGAHREFPLEPMPVADFYARVLRILDELGIETHIQPTPTRCPTPSRSRRTRSTTRTTPLP